jgi:GT2 family glycosyltransferase
MKHVDVVIISWAKDAELEQVTKTGLDSLFASEPDTEVTFHAYVVETNPKINYDYYNKEGQRHTTTTLRPIGEFGYHKYLNLGRKAGKSEYVVLCNSDLTYEKYWASNIIYSMANVPGSLSASPWCPQTQNDNSQHVNTLYSGYRVRGELAGWCIFQKREIYDKIGDLDEQFTHWYCDNDYGMTLQKIGIIHLLVPSSIVNHHSDQLGVTHKKFDAEYQQRTTINQQIKFQNKWGIPYGPL